MQQVAVQHRPLPDLVAERLLEEIVRGRFKSGQRLPEVELAERMGVSRSPMRQALHQLATDGVVDIEPRKGARVSELDPVSAANFYDCRILLQGRCAALAAPNVRDADVAEAEKLLRLLEDAGKQGQSFEWLTLVEQFHRVYEGRCPNDELVAILHSLQLRVRRYRAIGIALPSRMSYSLAQHGRILEAMRARDPDALYATTVDLLQTSKEGIVGYLRETTKDAGRDDSRPIGVEKESAD